MSNKKKMAVGITAAVVALTIAVMFIFTMNNQTASPADMLSLGERYLLEMQFEQALVQFLAVIEIEPNNVRAYLGAAEAFVGLGQTENARNILREGYEQTGSYEIRDKLIELAPDFTAGDVYVDAERDEEIQANEYAEGDYYEYAATNNESNAAVGEAYNLNISVGEIIQFGPYNWRVLDVDGNQALIITDRIIRRRTYHHTFEAVTWETSEIREYLNSAFFNSFDAADRARILETLIKNDDNPWDWYWPNLDDLATVPGGNNTTDKIFFLSIDEVLQYFGDSGMIAQGANIGAMERSNNSPPWPDWGIYGAGIHDQYSDARVAFDSEGWSESWWLRSPGSSPTNATFVFNFTGFLSFDGTVGGDEFWYETGLPGVRPAMWKYIE